MLYAVELASCSPMTVLKWEGRGKGGGEEGKGEGRRHAGKERRGSRGRGEGWMTILLAVYTTHQNMPPTHGMIHMK